MKITGRQLTIMVVAVCAAAVLTPAAVYATTGNAVNITDPVNASQKARVIGGKLAVGDGSGALTVDGAVVAKEPASFSAFKRVVNNGNDELVIRDIAAGGRISLGTLVMSRVTGSTPIIVQLRTFKPNTAHACTGAGLVAREIGQFSLGANATSTVNWSPSLRVPTNASEVCLVAFTNGGTNGDLTNVMVTGGLY
jgi:hypothetical protein